MVGAAGFEPTTPCTPCFTSIRNSFVNQAHYTACNRKMPNLCRKIESHANISIWFFAATAAGFIQMTSILGEERLFL